MAYIGKNPKVKSIVSEGDTLANLTAEPRKEGRMVYAEDTKKFYWDDGTTLTVVGTEATGGNDNVIADNLVDMDASTNYYNATGSISGLNVKNASDGDVTQLVVVNTSAASITVNWTNAVSINAASNNHTVSVGAAANYTIAHSNGTTYVSLIEGDASPPFPTGVLGDLTILNGQNISLASSAFYDYANIDIQTGGTLTITDTGNTWDPLEIYAAGTFNVDGQIVFRDTERSTTNKTGNFEEGSAYNVTTTQVLGGSGGAGGTSSASGGSGGSGTNGYGGGAGGGGAYVNNEGSVASRNGGAGGSNNGGGASGGGLGGSGGTGASGNITNANGSTGGSGSTGGGTAIGGNGGSGGGSGAGGGAAVSAFGSFNFAYVAAGGGGGGGHKGNHGGILYMYCTSGVTGSGTINLSGTNGFNGGNGGNASSANSANTKRGSGGGGGGGGAGGNGGYIHIKAPSFTPSVDVSGGSGGGGGTRGAPSGGAFGVNGSTGTTGNAGSIINL
jgi:hypothetical protein